MGCKKPLLKFNFTTLWSVPFLLVVGFSFFERGLLLDLGAKITRSTGQYNGNGRVDSGFLKKDISCRIHATACIVEKVSSVYYFLEWTSSSVY